MNRHYLNVPFQEKDEAKALGARFDWDRKQWYVPQNVSLTLFERWMPAESATNTQAIIKPVQATVTEPSQDLTKPIGMSLSQLLAGVSSIVAQAWSEGVWAVMEIVNLRVPHNNHVYLEVSERTPDGRQVAFARAMIWADTASQILPEFERLTGAQLQTGIKVLVRARPVFHVQFGFSLQIDGIDAEFTLGHLEARRREIRERLQREKVFDNNRQLEPVWDFERVLVVSPKDAAGLGDFMAEAARLEQFGLCHFTYLHSRFQGETAAREIANVLEQALATMQPQELPDAVVIIRGGGAVNDLAWLDNYDLARTVCDLPIPVLTGIGHQRDSTIIDEVAHMRFDTPSKVIVAIETRIRERAREAALNAQTLFESMRSIIAQAKEQITQHQLDVDQLARGQIVHARQSNLRFLTDIRASAQSHLHAAQLQSQKHYVQVRDLSVQQLHQTTQKLSSTFVQLQNQTREQINHCTNQLNREYEFVLSTTRTINQQQNLSLSMVLRNIFERAHHQVVLGRQVSESLIGEILGQGPQKTLNRGFAMVRDRQGAVITDSSLAATKQHLTIEFRDGDVDVIVQSSQKANISN